MTRNCEFFAVDIHATLCPHKKGEQIFIDAWNFKFDVKSTGALTVRSLIAHPSFLPNVVDRNKGSPDPNLINLKIVQNLLNVVSFE